MNLIVQYTLQLLGLIFGSSILTYYLNKNKVKAETSNLIGKTYGDLIDDLRKMVEFQGEQIKSMQAREIELLKIINVHNETEKDLRRQIKALETKLSAYINENK